MQIYYFTTFFLFVFASFCSNCHGVVNGELFHHVMNATAGNIYTVKITLANDEEEPLTIHLSQSDYTYNAKGENFYEDVGTLPRSNARWVELKNHAVTLAPKSKSDVYYTIRTPQQELTPGTYWSLIFIEPQKHINPIDDNSEGLKLTLKIRYAYQVITTFAGGKADLKVVSSEIIKNESEKKLRVVLENTGDIFLNPQINLKIYDNKGVQAKLQPDKEERLFPNTSVSIFYDLSELSAQNYTALILMDDINHHVFGKRFTFNLAQ